MMTANIEHTDVLIVGSGPAGCSTALHLVRRDPRWSGRVIVVEKAYHPREKLCGGGVTHLGENILADLGLPLAPPHFEVREARLVFQDLSYSFFGDPVFRVVHRAEFDHWLVREVEKRGVEVRQGEGVIDLVVHRDYVEVTTAQGTYRARTVVAADGSRSVVRRRLKWDDGSHVSRLIEVLTPESAGSSWEVRDGVAVFDFSSMISHQLQGYYWDFPSLVQGELKLNRGVFDSRARPERPRADLKQTLGDSLAARERKLEDYELKGHPIRWFHWRGTFARPRVVLVGDAAGADPLMGEGISIALAYGRVAAAAIEDAFARQDFSFRTYKRRLLGNGILCGLLVRSFLAGWAYWIENPRWFRLGWRVARWLIGLTPWRNPRYVPTRQAPERPAGSRSS